MTTKLDLTAFTEDLKLLDAYQAISRFLHKHSLRSSRGISTLKEKLESYLEGEEPKLTDAELLRFYHELRVYGRKTIKFIELTDYQKHYLAKWASADLPVPCESPFASSFPLPIRESAALKQKQAPILSYTQADNKSLEVTLVYCSGREYEKREEIDENKIKDEYREEISSHGKIVLERLLYVQAYDFLHFDIHRGLITIGIDDKIRHKCAVSPKELFDKYKELISRELLQFPQRHQYLWEIDLFPTIQSFYDNEDVGSVTNIAFLCSTGVTRTEKTTPREFRSKHIDIRKEAYHLKGKEVLPEDTLSMHRITVHWLPDKEQKNQSPYYSTMSLNGSRSNADAGQGLYSAEITENIIKEEFDFGVSKLLHHVELVYSKKERRASRQQYEAERKETTDLELMFLDQFSPDLGRARAFSALLARLKPEFTRHLGYGVLREIILSEIDISDEEIFRMMRHISSPVVGLFTMHFELNRDDKDRDSIEISPSILKEAYQRGNLEDPETGELYKDFEDRIGVFFEGTEALRSFLEPSRA